MNGSNRTSGSPHVVIIGAGFGWLSAARALGRERWRITLFDRNNYHLFQPLLYQVATAGLAPSDVAYPIRSILRRQRNTSVVMAEVQAIDAAHRRVLLHDRQIDYDYLVVAAGATHSYFGHPEWATRAPGLKDVNDALEIRHQVLQAFERAEVETDLASQPALLTFVIIGAGPTGVELAGARGELAWPAPPWYVTSETSTRRRPTSSWRRPLQEVRVRFNALMDVEKHYLRKENLLFPFLESRNITGPPTVM